MQGRFYKKVDQKAISRGRSVYIVVGMQTLVDAEREWRLNIMFPIDSAIGAAAGVPISLTNIHDVGASKLWKDGYETLAKTGQCSIGRETVGKCSG